MLILFVGLVLAGLLWWFNSYLSRPESVETLRAFVTNAIGAPVRFEKLQVNILTGLSLDKIVADNPEAAIEKELLRIPKVRVNYNLWALLQKRVEMTEILLLQPRIAVELSPENKVIWSRLNPASQTAKEPKASPAASRSSAEIQDLEVEVKSFNITDGSFVMRGADGAERLVLSGINNEAQMKSSDLTLSAMGKVRVAEVALQRLRLREVQSAYTYDQGLIKLPAIQGQAYRGTLNGAFEQQVNDAELPFTFKMNLANVDVNELLKEVAQKPDKVSGQLSATTSWRGSLTNVQGISGKGNFEVLNGQLIQLEFFRQLASVLNVKELAQPDFVKCRSDFVVENEIVTLSSLVLNSTLFDFTTSGTVGFDTALNLQCELVLKPELVKFLPAGLGERFTLRDDGARTVAFNITGSVEKTQSDLWLKLALGPTANPVDAVKQGLEGIKGLFR
jgi:hypothetical protein